MVVAKNESRAEGGKIKIKPMRASDSNEIDRVFPDRHHDIDDLDELDHEFDSSRRYHDDYYQPYHYHDDRYYPRRRHSDEIDREFDREYDDLSRSSYRSRHHYDRDFKDEFQKVF